MSAPRTLPRPLTSFIGRETELAAIRRLLPTTRLLTLTGPGGSGKTRLALQAASVCATGYADGACFVDLAPIADVDLVISTIAHALGLHERDGQAHLARLVEYLRDQALLLLLDNFEQVLPAAPQLAALLSAAPQLTLLITSRAPLRLSGEQEFAVLPLALPEPEEMPPLEQLAQSEAVQLFVARARSVKPDFALTTENAPTVVRICRRLDGLPLAIELAAARVKLLPPAALLTRLDARLTLLTNGVSDGPARHRTLRDAIAWSYDLLGEPEQRLFRRLAVFAGGWTLEAAEAICAGVGRWESRGGVASPSPNPQVPTPLLDGLSSLLDKSLLQQRQADGEPRFTMLETIRTYALARLIESGEIEGVRDRHLRFFLELAERAFRPLSGPEGALWAQRLADDHDNLRAALGWALEAAQPASQGAPSDRRASRRPELALRLAEALAKFWSRRGYINEGRAWLQKTLDTLAVVEPGAAHSPVVAMAFFALGTQDWFCGEWGLARAHAETSVALSRAIGDPSSLAHGLVLLGMVAQSQNDLAVARSVLAEGERLFRTLDYSWGRAWALTYLAQLPAEAADGATPRALLEESLALWRRTGDLWGIAIPLYHLGLMAYQQGEYAAARVWLEEALANERAVGDRWIEARVLNLLGRVIHCMGDHERGAALFAEALALQRATGDQRGIAESWHDLGQVALRAGNDEQAAGLFRQSLQLCRDRGYQDRLAACFIGLAEVAATRGWPDRAGELLGAVDALPDSLGGPLSPADRQNYDRAITAARAMMEEAAFAAAAAAGRAMSLEQAIALALQELPGVVITTTRALATSPALEHAAQLPDGPDALTAREVEVLRLIATGLSNKAVAERLTVSLSTVQTHLHAIYGKLGVRSRSAATRYAWEHRLLVRSPHTLSGAEQQSA